MHMCKAGVAAKKFFMSQSHDDVVALGIHNISVREIRLRISSMFVIYVHQQH